MADDIKLKSVDNFYKKDLTLKMRGLKGIVFSEVDNLDLS